MIGLQTEASEEAEGVRRGPSRTQLAALLAAVAFLAGVIGWRVGSSPSSGTSVDIGFAQDMIDHHDQAVSLSLLQLSNGSPQGMRSFATDIIITQRYEIGLLDAYLQRWGKERGQPDRTAMAWMDMATPVDRMPGLASAEDVERLREARGLDADRLFYRLIVAHHEGGIHMAEYAAKNARDPRIRKLAAGMARNQRLEIAEMRAAARRLNLEPG